MSSEARAAIAAAASTVAGVNCSPYYRQSLDPGDACVRLSVRTKASNGFGYVDTWQVWLALPQDVEDAEKWLDDRGAEVVAALNPEFIGGIRTITPAELVLGGGTATNGVIYEGAREG
ncbi:MAG TPA: hypothetical protein VNS81_06565 [Nocardioides sp.]|nr:hypothetical protein [Nocardioides sp.]